VPLTRVFAPDWLGWLPGLFGYALVDTDALAAIVDGHKARAVLAEAALAEEREHRAAAEAKTREALLLVGETTVAQSRAVQEIDVLSLERDRALAALDNHDGGPDA
jgi:hypothetical protein